MRKTTLCLGLLAGVFAAVPASAENTEYPALTPHYPFQRSYLTRRIVVVPPYRHLFRLRIYTTPQQPPYYNVPPYPVITPY